MKKLTLLLFLALAVNVHSQEKLKPPVTKITDATLTKFISDLNTAVKNKDKDFIIKSLSPQVRSGFGGSGGIKEFKASWNWDSGKSSFWDLMKKILALGGGTYAGDNSYAMPYVYADWPEGNTYDAFQHVAITGTKVNVRDKPDLKNSSVLGKFNYDIVKVDYEKSYPSRNAPRIKGVHYIGSKLWYYVESLDGKLKGFVYWNYVWSPIGYRLGFYKTGGKWQIRFLLAGD